ncbi:hypothetical protein BY458DRAFT_534925 [Sporodiniella umbellata]|nr:hypothetical protein BY458DRAFT_534925 [Sporodiniella umbellata]
MEMCNRLIDYPFDGPLFLLLFFFWSVKKKLKIIREKFSLVRQGFFDGKEEFLSMTKQPKRKRKYVYYRFIYKADSAVRLQKTYDIRTCVSKICFDYYEIIGSCLTILKTVANQHKYVSVDVFEKLNVWFVNAAVFLLPGEIFHCWREGVFNFESNLEDKKMYQQNAINFYWAFKCKLEEVLDAIENINNFHKKKNIKSGYVSGETPILLLQIDNLSIIKLIENDHKKDMNSRLLDLSEHDQKQILHYTFTRFF